MPPFQQRTKLSTRKGIRVDSLFFFALLPTIFFYELFLCHDDDDDHNNPNLRSAAFLSRISSKVNRTLQPDIHNHRGTETTKNPATKFERI